jgi:hypothetical protein
MCILVYEIYFIEKQGNKQIKKIGAVFAKQMKPKSMDYLVEYNPRLIQNSHVKDWIK